MNSPDVVEIIISYLKEHGYDGLLNESEKCWCEPDIFKACAEIGFSFHECRAGVRVPCDTPADTYTIEVKEESDA